MFKLLIKEKVFPYNMQSHFYVELQEYSATWSTKHVTVKFKKVVDLKLVVNFLLSRPFGKIILD